MLTRLEMLGKKHKFMLQTCNFCERDEQKVYNSESELSLR